MVAVGFLVLWLAYQNGVWGYTLLKGYNITWAQLANPINPYQWPALPGTPDLVPPGQILPHVGTGVPAQGQNPPPGQGQQQSTPGGTPPTTDQFM